MQELKYTRHKTYIDSRHMCFDLDKSAIELDNVIIDVNGYKVLLKIECIFDKYSLRYTYDTGVDINSAFKEDNRHFADDAYEIISNRRDNIEDVLYSLFYKKYKLNKR